jgi:hypothetical protein
MQSRLGFRFSILALALGSGATILAFHSPAKFALATNDSLLAPQPSIARTTGAAYWLDTPAHSGAVAGLARATAAGYRYQAVDTFEKPGFQIDGTSVAAVVPEPAALLFIGTALLAIGAYNARK